MPITIETVVKIWDSRHEMYLGEIQFATGRKEWEFAPHDNTYVGYNDLMQIGVKIFQLNERDGISNGYPREEEEE